MQSDIEFAYLHSVKELSMNVNTIVPTFKHRNEELNSYLTKELSTNAYPSLLFLDGNSIDLLSSDELIQINLLRNKGYIVIVDHPDLLVTKNAENKLIKILKIADFAVIHNPNIDFPKNLSDRLLLWPSFPIPKSPNSVPFDLKHSGILFSGGRHRGQRQIYSNYLKKRNIEVIDELYPTLNKDSISKKVSNENYGKNKSGFLSYQDYFDSLGFYSMAFTNGYRNPRESLLAFRACELMYKKAMVFYEVGSWINYFFTPYEHYIPVENAPDLVDKVRYFIKNPGDIIRIVDSAKQVMDNLYSDEIFWQKLSSKINKN
jgi:hypothetical protein